MKRLRRVEEPEVIAEFLKNEFYQGEFHEDREQFEKLVLEADITNDVENALRRALLFRRRGHMWRELPADTQWWQVEFEDQVQGQVDDKTATSVTVGGTTITLLFFHESPAPGTGRMALTVSDLPFADYVVERYVLTDATVANGDGLWFARSRNASGTSFSALHARTHPPQPMQPVCGAFSCGSQVRDESRTFCPIGVSVGE